MSSTYTGDDTATQAPSPLPAKNATPAFTLPADGDALNAASIAQALKASADAVDFVYDRTAILDSANTFTGSQTITGSAATAAIIATGGAGGAAGVSGIGTGASPGGNFEGGPTDGAGINAVGGGTNGSAIIATPQGTGAALFASSGDITAAAGNIKAQGTPVGNAGPGLVRCVRSYSTATALLTTNVTPASGYGATATVDAVTGNDQLFTVKITANGAGLANPAVFALGWADGTWSNAPHASVWLIATDDAAAVGLELTVTPAATTLTVSMPLLPTAGKFYKFAGVAIGR